MGTVLRLVLSVLVLAGLVVACALFADFVTGLQTEPARTQSQATVADYAYPEIERIVRQAGEAALSVDDTNRLLNLLGLPAALINQATQAIAVEHDGVWGVVVTVRPADPAIIARNRLRDVWQYQGWGINDDPNASLTVYSTRLVIVVPVLVTDDELTLVIQPTAVRPASPAAGDPPTGA